MKYLLKTIIITYLLMSIFTSSFAATIIVNAPNGSLDETDGLCSLSEAIKNANRESISSPFSFNCVEGEFGTDTIVLSNNVTLNEVIDDDNNEGNSGTPPIESPIILNGNGFSIKRDPNLICNINNVETPGEFRLLTSTFASILTIIDTTLENGCSDGPSGIRFGYGGGMFNDGILSLSQATFKNNQAKKGGGIMSQGDLITTIEDSSFINNSAGTGAALFLESDVTTIRNSTFYGNTATFTGGAIFLSYFRASLDEAIITNIKNTSFHKNESGGKGGAIYAIGIIQNLTNSLFAGNISQNSQGNGSIDPILFDTQDSDCYLAEPIGGNSSITGSNNISHYSNSKSNCPGLISPQIDLLSVGTIDNNGGPTMTVAILGNSNAFDNAINGTALGQRGLPNIGTRDIGAFETRFPDLCFTANFRDISEDGFVASVQTTQDLIISILCSNSNGDQTDTIRFFNGFTLDTQYKQFSTDNRTGTPVITTDLIIDGRGRTLKRNNNLTCNLNGVHETGEFRLLENNFQNNLTLMDITLENGCADGSNNESVGGALFNDGDISLINTHFIQNQAHDGGGAIYHENARTINEITDSTFTNNFTNGTGGAINNQGVITLIQDTSFVENSAIDSGGAIANQQLISVIKNSTFSNNDTSVSGGAIAIANFAGVTILHNNTFSANSAAIDGGAIYNNNTIASIQNNTFSNNSATNLGGAIRNDTGSTVNSLINTLFHNNTNGDCRGSNFNGNNNLSDNALSGCPALITPILTSATVKQLADNGGLTKTHGLQPGSQALDASVNGISTDQRGFPRNGVRDIGAFEAQSDELCPVSLQANGFTTVVSNVDELYTAINCSNVNGNNPDTITLSADVTILFDYEIDPVIGITGTPGITTPVVLDGQGFTIQRDANLTCNSDDINDPGEFRLLHNHTGNTLDLLNITLTNGCADGPLITSFARGGALYNQGTLSIINSSFTQNQANFGGAIFHADGIITEISKSTFSANTSIKFGGALMSLSNISTIQNSTFSGNSSTDSIGGAIYNGNGNSITNILNSTFSGNSSSPVHSGGAIYSDGNINNIRNSLFHDNSTDDCDSGTGFINGFNNISDNANSGCPGLLATTLTTSTIGILAGNGGSTQTHALLAGSEAFNTAGNGSLPNDQRGLFAADGARDIGAVEDQAPIVTAPMDMTIEATAFLTPISIINATVNDPDQPNLMANTTSNLGPFALGQYTIIWTVTDNHGRTDSDSQIITIVDTTPPIITLSGNAIIVLDIGNSYNDSGASAEDLVDGMISSGAINVVNPVNTAFAGNYTITYDVQDNAGNDATQITRLVKVQASIGGTISGLVNSNTVTITDGNESGALSNGSYTFNTQLDSGASYSVSMTDSPTSQVCEISNNTGTITDSNINNINVTCGPLVYFIGGMASGLEIGNPVILELDTELLTVTDNAAFVFLTPLQDGENYTVTIDTLPISYDCDLVNPTGMIATNDITDVEVSCTIIDNVFNDSFEDLP